MGEESKSEDLSTLDGFMIGVLVTIMTLMIIASLVLWATNQYPCDTGRPFLERAEVRIMAEEEISPAACRFATDEGFVLYHDGQLYFEAGE